MASGRLRSGSETRLQRHRNQPAKLSQLLKLLNIHTYARPDVSVLCGLGKLRRCKQRPPACGHNALCAHRNFHGDIATKRRCVVEHVWKALARPHLAAQSADELPHQVRLGILVMVRPLDVCDQPPSIILLSNRSNLIRCPPRDTRSDGQDG